MRRRAYFLVQWSAVYGFETTQIGSGRGPHAPLPVRQSHDSRGTHGALWDVFATQLGLRVSNDWLLLVLVDLSLLSLTFLGLISSLPPPTSQATFTLHGSIYLE